MKFRALLYKEIRECMPFAIFIAVILTAMAFVIVQIANSKAELGVTMFSKGDIEVLGGWLLAFSVVLGFLLSIRQYHAEFSEKTWGFLLHRSVNRGTILFAKLLTGLLCFIPIMIIWGFFYLYTHDKPFFQPTLATRIFWQGLILIIFGYVAYLAIAIAKCYTTKLLSVAFLIWMFIAFIAQRQLCWAWITVTAAVAILLVQITDAFLNREFE